MTNPFVQDRTKLVSQIDQTIGPAWFSRDSDNWEKETSPPVLIGGHGGGTLKSEILDIVAGAEQIIAICSFLIGDDNLIESILDAARRGVRVYILTASKDRIAQDNLAEGSLQKKVQIENEQMLNKICRKTLLRDAQVHAKFILSDPAKKTRKGVLSTANFTYHALLHPEMGLTLGDDQIEELFMVFCSAWWDLGERELLKPNMLTDARKIEPPVSGEVSKIINNLQAFALTYRNRVTKLRSEISRLVLNAQDELFLATYGVSDDDPIFEDILAQSSVKNVKILVRPRVKTTPLLHQLKENGAEVRGLDDLHAKVVCTKTSRGVEALLMTANLEKISLQQGFEVGLLTSGSIAEQIIELMDHWWENANWEYSISRKLGEHLGPYRVLKQNEFDEREVIESKTLPLGEITIEDLSMLDSFMPDFPKVDDVQKVEYSWRTIPRELPKKCKSYNIDNLAPYIDVWKCRKNQIFISVSSPEELSSVLDTEDLPNVPIVYRAK